MMNNKAHAKQSWCMRKGYMSTYYSGKRAQHYNTRWNNYTARTLKETKAIIDVATLRLVPERLGRCPRVLDVACGTGILLKQLLVRVPGIEAYGVDASADMLEQARVALKGQLQVYLEHVQVGADETAGLPFAPETFDLITCTNALHDIPEPSAMLAGLKRLLAPGGQLVVEDFAPRKPRFFWAAFEWLLRSIESSCVRAYTLSEARALCKEAGLHVVSSNMFTVDWFWRGWVVRAYRISSVSG
jgi:ubiquinone/menaquinone biosynthesis C-methylase UbiE